MRVEHTGLLFVSNHVSVPPAFHLVGALTRRPYDRTVALQRMQQAGAFLTTAEQVTFQLLNSADNER